MIAAFAPFVLPDGIDFDALTAAIAKCERPVVTATIAAQDKRHSKFLIDTYAEQRAIAVARGNLAERRRQLRAKETKIDSEDGLQLEAEALDDRARNLVDGRALDQSEQEMIGYFKAQYLRQCSGRGS